MEKNCKGIEKEPIKVILVGSSGVGKTSLINCAKGEPFKEGTQISTMVCSFIKLELKIKEQKYCINLWDTIGQERFRSLTSMFLKDSKIVIFVFDITRTESFEDLDYWFEIVQGELGDDIIRGIIANKRDLIDEQKVDDDVIEEYVNKKGEDFVYCSALDAKGFNKFLEKLFIKYLEKYGYEEMEKENEINIDNNKNKGKKLQREKSNGNKVKNKKSMCC